MQVKALFRWFAGSMRFHSGQEALHGSGAQMVVRKAIKLDSTFVGYWLRADPRLMHYTCSDKQHGHR